jgi:hypothetical protein
VTVAVDSRGESIHNTAPVIWKARIAEGKWVSGFAWPSIMWRNMPPLWTGSSVCIS